MLNVHTQCIKANILIPSNSEPITQSINIHIIYCICVQIDTFLVICSCCHSKHNDNLLTMSFYCLHWSLRFEHLTFSMSTLPFIYNITLYKFQKQVKDIDSNMNILATWIIHLHKAEIIIFTPTKTYKKTSVLYMSILIGPLNL